MSTPANPYTVRACTTPPCPTTEHWHVWGPGEQLLGTYDTQAGAQQLADIFYGRLLASATRQETTP